MIDNNEFKRKVKDWIKKNPAGSEQELTEYCEDLIPPADFSNQKWLIDQTIHWYRYVIAERDSAYLPEDGDDIN